VEREATGIGPAEVDPTLADGKTVLKQVQERIVQIQSEPGIASFPWRWELWSTFA
jgi:hypothetical protein